MSSNTSITSAHGDLYSRPCTTSRYPTIHEVAKSGLCFGIPNLFEVEMARDDLRLGSLGEKSECATPGPSHYVSIGLRGVLPGATVS